MTQLAVEGEIESWASCILEKSLTGFALLIAFSLIFLVVAYILKKYDEGKLFFNSSFISSLSFIFRGLYFELGLNWPKTEVFREVLKR